jgi:hypothetical protein
VWRRTRQTCGKQALFYVTDRCRDMLYRGAEYSDDGLQYMRMAHFGTDAPSALHALQSKCAGARNLDCSIVGHFG